MAEEKSEIKDFLIPTIFALIIISMFAAYIGGRGLTEIPVLSGDSELSQTDESFEVPNIATVSVTEDLPLGTKIITKSLASIRREVAGTIIGEKKSNVIGQIIDGPIEAFGKRWYRVDFEEAPDGFVEEDFITSKITRFRLSNLGPIVYSALLPLLIFLNLILFLLFFLLKFKIASFDNFLNKKKEFEIQKHRDFQKKVEPIPQSEIPNSTNEDYYEESTFNPESVTQESELGNVPKNPRWEYVKGLIESHNSNDWRQSIIEADIMLDQMLNSMNIDGETIGDKLQKIEPSDFLTLNKAWEAHNVRNKIAHDGASYMLSHVEAKRVIGLFEEVFKEFFYI